MPKRTLATALLMLIISATGFAQVVLDDTSIEEGQTLTLTADTEYLLDGFVYVEEGAVLNIEPGTVIKAMQNPTTGDNASALIISRGGKIYAKGTPYAPIIFTSEVDNLTFEDRGLWGGVIILGAATTNRGVEGQIEGVPSGETRAAYGGEDDNDNSGVFRYVSIRHGGSVLGTGDEINGLTMGAVGRRTEISHVEVFSNLDDGFEWFGGTVNTKYLVAAFCGDDGFDYDEGWRGLNQFWFGIQDVNTAGRVGEHDGGTIQESAPPFSTPYIANATYVGAGIQNAPQGDGSEAIVFRDNAGGKYLNSIITEYNASNGGFGVTVEDLENNEDSRARLENGDLVMSNNLWWEFGEGNTLEAISDQEFVRDHLAANNNQIVNPELRGVSRTDDGGLDPRPAASAAASGATVIDNAFFDAVGFYGAFDPNRPLWTNGWTALSDYGHTQGIIDLNDNSINAGETLTLESGNTYLLDGFTYVEEGATLIIEPGVVIKAKQQPTTADNSSALIISRGAQIFANGTAEYPIIFTSEVEDLGFEDRGLWGGVIILGAATTNRGAEGQIEGVPSGETRAAYGGDDDNDNSGVFRYVSIRHGGSVLGTGDEINGLTMGAVGAGTTIEYVEVYANLDDGFEWFGGTVNTRYLVAAFCGDDGFDYDEGWRGKNQFWFGIQDVNTAGRVGEHDGGTLQETAPPFSTPYILNATYIGAGIENTPQGDGSEAIVFRDNAGGTYMNGIITEYNANNGGKGITVEDLGDMEDSRSRLENGDLLIANNLWWQFGDGNDIDGVTDQDFVRDHLLANNNQIVNPYINAISRSNDGGLDPRPAAGGPAAAGAAAPPSGFFQNVPFYGAFDPNQPLWTNGWTALSDYNHTNDRYIGHVTRTDGGFETQIRMLNEGQKTAIVNIRPYAIDGSALTPVTASVAGGDVQSYSAADLFGGEEVSHFSFSAPAYVSVTAVYNAASGDVATAELPGADNLGLGWAFYSTNWDVVFDGLALVNHSGAEASVTFIQKDWAGNEIARAVAQVDAGAKLLQVFDALDGFVNFPGSVIEVHSSAPAAAVFLRGTRPGAATGFLYVTVPIPLD